LPAKELEIRGKALDNLYEYNEAIKYLDKALAINPNYVPALERKGNTLSNMGDDTGAKQYIDKALFLGGSVNPHDEN
jgi:tetratricopeptide (TPR) repeat protein